MAARAPGLGISFYTEPELAPLWDRPMPPIGVAELDALLTLGGDGTLLRGARAIGGKSLPFCVNLGRVGFLTSCTRLELDSALVRPPAAITRSNSASSSAPRSSTRPAPGSPCRRRSTTSPSTRRALPG
ncbi:MAG: NAD(+)/NADH kinase [Gemmatimonadales bacterium]